MPLPQNSTSVLSRPPEAERAWFADDCISVYLTDGRTISVPIAWYSELWDQNDDDLAQCEVFGRGTAVYWPTLKIEIPTEWIVQGRHG